ncbi:hypothetical protein TrST_g8140 [Triparma strigata]|uniref:RNA-binding S4 domain-containing protein n=1 Tax=Triparma strigata TaxID=1606541 RepID=A0A9W7B2K9_9STRA|nr:hypothetical protein TrST_g8140 [Triparma strigata]
MHLQTLLVALLFTASSSYVLNLPSRPFSTRAVTSLRDAQVSDIAEPSPLIDLQTFLKLADVVESGGQAKVIIQAGEVFVNRQVETRRAKKLFEGDMVAVNELDEVLNVAEYVKAKGYVYTKKDKKEKKDKVKKAVDDEFKGEFRSEEWREARKKKKYEKKAEKGKEKGTLRMWRFDSERSNATQYDEDKLAQIQAKVMEREAYRQSRKYDEADDVRVYLEMDYSVQVDDDSRIWYFEES